MSKFRKKKLGGSDQINTSALPDIIFMLLFFFMVTTVLRENSSVFSASKAAE
jgi:biopolymer transport protein ExbD